MDESAALRMRTTDLLDLATDEPLPSLDELVPLVFSQLQALAHRQLARDPNNVTLQTTALVHEAYLKLVDDHRVTSRGRAYFFAAAARAMREVLLDAARRRRSVKRGGGLPLTTLGDDQGGAIDAFASELLDLEEALEALGARNLRQMQVVECRYFGGMSVPETAAALGVSERTVKADWAFARAWLYDALRESGRD
ncbi:MAG TPA: ECF-type sigma factor [Gemmatimonadales bacterium]|nr:ECF-type sigma factor [Gemmatimonadales bacterium]